MTEIELKQVLDSQRFYNNTELSDMISKAENNGKYCLSDDDLSEVSAAGDIIIDVETPKKRFK